jgi:site-specific recombinase XerD
MTTITELLPRYEEYMVHERALAPATVRAYLLDLVKLAKFTALSVEEVDRNELRRYIRALSKRGLAPATIRRMFHGYGTFWKWLLLEHVVTENATAGLTLPRLNRTTPNWLSEDELRRFANTPTASRRKKLRFRDAVAWKMLAWLGLRRQELLNLKVANVHLADKVIVIRNTKSKRDRALGIPDELYPLLKRLCLGKDADAYVFGMYGGRWNLGSFNKAFKRHIQRCGFPEGYLTPHTLRHTFGTLLVMRGVELHVVKELMGHERLSSTERYLHASRIYLKDAMDKHPLHAGNGAHQ